MDGYRRPPIVIAEFRDAEGAVIPYGARWRDTPSEDLPYSITTHPERFAPLVEVARALETALPAAHREGGDGIPVAVVVTEFPGVVIRVGERDFPFPVCACDACDEDVEGLAEQMEHLVEAVVAERYVGDRDSHRYWGEWGERSGWSAPATGSPQGNA